MRVVLIVIALLLVGLVPLVPASGSCSGAGNDCFDAATAYFGRSITVSNAGATMEDGEPASGCALTKTMWYAGTPRTNGTLRLYLYGDWFNAIAVYRGSALTSLTEIGCTWTSYDDDIGRWEPGYLSVPCVADVPLAIQVGGRANATGSVRIESAGCGFDPTDPDAPTWCTGTFAPCPAPRAGAIRVAWRGPFWDGGQLISLSHYNVYRAAGSCSAPFELHASVPSRSSQPYEETSYDDTGLAANATYCYRVTAVNSVGESAPSPQRLVTTWNYARPPASISATQAAYEAVGVTWTASPDHTKTPPVTSYRLYVAFSPAGPFELLADMDPAQRYYPEGNVPAYVTRCYYVVAVNAVGESAPSATACADVVPPPSAPQELTVRHAATSVPPVAFELRWQPPATADRLQGYHVWHVGASGARTLQGTTAPDTTRFVVTGRLPAWHYEYVVTAFNVAGDGDDSERRCAVWPVLPGDPCR